MALFRRDRSGGAPKVFTRALERVAVSLPGAEAHVPAILEFVLTGDRPQVLADVQNAQRPQFGYHVPDDRYRALYVELGSVDAEAWVRWGQVLEASLGTSQWTTPLTAAGALPAWLEHLVNSLGTAFGGHGYGDRTVLAAIPVEFGVIGAVAEAGGVPVPDLLDALFTASTNLHYTESGRARRVVAATPGFGAAVLAHLDRLQGRLSSGSVEQRLLVIDLVVAVARTPLDPLAPMLADAATATSARVRAIATPLVQRAMPAAEATLRELAVEGKPDVRALALDLLWHHGGEAARGFAHETAAADRAERIRSLVDAWDGTGASPSAELPPELAVPDPAPIRWRVELTPALRERVEQTAEWHNHQVAQINLQNAHHQARYQAHYPTAQLTGRQDLPQDPALARRLLEVLDSDRPPTVRAQSPDWQLGATVGHLAALPEVSAVAVMKVLADLGYLLDHRKTLSMHAVQALEACHARDGQPDLLTLQTMLDDAGQPGVEIVWKAITSSWHGLARGWPDEQVWPFLSRNIDFVVAHSRVPDGDYLTDASAFYRLVGSLPAQPPVLVEQLYVTALGLTKAHRGEAQAALRTHPERTRRAAAALTDGKAEVRTIAATWLGKIADPESLPALEAAVAKEKQDVAKGAMLDALEALGRPVEAYLDRDRLAADAEKAAAKGLPKDLDWLSWDRLPEVRWADSGDRVPLPVVQHLVGQAVRAKSPEPNAILRKYVGMLVETDRQAFAQALLESWLAADIQPISETEALQRAQAHASGIHSYVTKYPAAAAYEQYKGQSLAQITAALLPAIARTPAGSEAASKGVLAVVAAAGGRDVVPPTERYLKEWYGQRAAQGKALIGMLAWVQHPSATQLLLSIGSRFRTKSFQVEATRQVEALAEREGWTVAELADRTVPTAGFDADGTLELSYGGRSFTARLLPDLTVELRTGDGAVVKTLPAPRQSDDPEHVKLSKAAFTAAKKELKSLASLQRQRLYEALCTERTWTSHDWQRFLAGHPVMRLLCQRLVWVAQPVGQPVDQPVDGQPYAFRLLDDGTLSDVDDQEVTLPDDGVVRLAHDTNLEPDQVQAWLAHLADYEVQPLFQQLGKGMHSLSDDERSRSAIEDFRGHTLEAFALRNRALKLGWTRGPAEDGGWFHGYLKRFPTLGLVAELGFTGNGLPEENRTVGLLQLTFAREAPEQSVHASQPVRLDDVPAVLLSETWHDVASIAAEGGGFDPDWERNTQF